MRGRHAVRMQPRGRTRRAWHLRHHGVKTDDPVIAHRAAAGEWIAIGLLPHDLARCSRASAAMLESGIYGTCSTASEFTGSRRPI